MADPVFEEPAVIRQRLKFNSARIYEINGRIRDLMRERSEYANRNDDLRSALTAQCDPDGHLPGCLRDEHCLGGGFC